MRSAMLALQEESEAYVTEILKWANMISIHAGRTTLHSKDIKLARLIRGERT